MSEHRSRTGTLRYYASEQHKRPLAAQQQFLSTNDKFERMVEILSPKRKPRQVKVVTLRKFSWEARNA